MLTRSHHRDSSLLCLLLAGCAVMPEPGYPPHRDAELVARCRVPDDGRLQVPASADDLVVHSLEAEPPPQGERYQPDGGRWLLYRGGTEVVVRTRVRVYGDRDPRSLLPEAVEWLQAP